MLKTRKVVSMLLVVAMLAAMLVVGIVATAAEGDTITIKFNNSNGWDTVYVHYWGNGETTWPGEPMTDLGEGIWSAEVPADVSVVFNNNNNGLQTGNIEGVQDGYTYNPDGSYTTAGGEQGEPDPVEMMTDYFNDVLSWGTVYVHYWGNGTSTWPGVAMTDNGEGTFSAEIPEGTSVVFTASSDGPQTVDITADADAVYTPTTTDDQGHYYVEAAAIDDEQPTEAPEDPTEEPTEAPEDPTQAPEDPTQAPEDPTEEPISGDDGNTVKVNGVTYDVHVGDKITYTYSLNLAGIGGKVGKITEIEGKITFDDSKLKVLTPVPSADDDDFEGYADLLPNVSGGQEACSVVDGSLYYLCSRPAGYNFSSETVFITVQFEVIAEGSSEIVNQIKNLGSGEQKLIYRNEIQTEVPDKTAVAVDCPHGEQPTEAPAQPTEAPEQPTEEPITGESKVIAEDWDGTTEEKPVQVGDIITVTSYLKVPDGKRVNSINFIQTYDPSKLELITPLTEVVYDEEEEEDVEISNTKLFPRIADPTANLIEGGIKANATKAKYGDAYKFNSEDSVLICAQYKVIAEGVSTVKTNIVTLATISKDNTMSNQIMGSEKVGEDEIFTKTVLEAPEHEQPTEAPEQPTEAPEQPTEAPEQPTEAPEQPTEAPEQPTEAPEQPTEAPSYDGVLIKADGVYYAVQKGDVFTYVYYLNTGEKLCSLDAETFYDATGLSWNGMAQKYDEDEEEWVDDMSDLFPILGDAVTLNAESEGRLKYNYSAAKGKNFSDDGKRLITAKFTVTAESGVYEINTVLHTVAGDNEHKYIFKDEVIDPLKFVTSKLFDKDSIEIPPYEGPVAEPTEAPEQPTDAPEQPTETPELPTENPVQPTDAPEQPTEHTHDLKFVDEVPATAESDGMKAHYVCSVCGKFYADAEGREEVTADSLIIPRIEEPTDPSSHEDPEEPTTPNPDIIPTGSNEIAIIFLMLLVLSAGVVFVVKKKILN